MTAPTTTVVDKRTLHPNHASRNPLQPVQPAQPHKKGVPLTDAQKNTRDINAKVRKAQAAALQVALDDFLCKRDEQIQAIADEHGRTEDYIKNILEFSSHYKNRREVSLTNAINHHESEIANKGESTAPGS